MMLAMLLLCQPAHAAERWAAYYTDTLPIAAFDAYQTLVFDSHAHPDLVALRYRDALALGYLSLAEKADYRPWTEEMRKKNLLLGPIPGRPGYYYIDVRKPEWAAMLVETIVPDLLRQGFGGLMLDTADTAIALEASAPKRYAGMKEATLNLIRSLRQHYPDLPIMLNRGFELLPEAAAEVNMLLAESIYTFYDTKTAKAHLQPEAHYQSVAAMLKKLQESNPGLKIYTLDYWPPEDAAGRKAIYAAQRAQGFIPYVSTYDLQSVVPEK